MAERVLVLSASVGAGHMRAAESVEAATRALLPDADVELVDVLAEARGWFRGLYGGGYLFGVERLPSLVGIAYDRLDRPWRRHPLRLWLQRRGVPRLVERLAREQPDIVVCTHFLPAEIAAWMRRRGLLAGHLSVVVTDAHPHAVWLHKGVDRWFLACDEADARLERLGVPAEARSVTGIPIDARFAEPRDRLAARRRHGLPTEGAIVLVTGGGLGLGPTESIVAELGMGEDPASLASESGVPEPLVVVVCGHNADLRRRLEAHPAARSGRLRVIGFTRDMDELMAASDLLVGKPGGLTTSEALARALPMALVPGVPGQEDRNAERLVEAGAAVICRDPATLGWKIGQLLGDAPRLRRMRIAAGAAARPRAAAAIASALLARDAAPAVPPAVPAGGALVP